MGEILLVKDSLKHYIEQNNKQNISCNGIVLVGEQSEHIPLQRKTQFSDYKFTKLSKPSCSYHSSFTIHHSPFTNSKKQWKISNKKNTQTHTKNQFLTKRLAINNESQKKKNPPTNQTRMQKPLFFGTPRDPYTHHSHN